MKLSDLKPTENNPRTITDEAKKGLATSLQTFGDISGIVYNAKLNRLVAGHQRVQVLRERYGDLSVTRKRDGTGQIVTPEGTFAVRFVEWDEAKTDAALLTANNAAIQGDWTDGLSDMAANLSDSLGNVFDDLRLGELFEGLIGKQEPPTDFHDVDENVPTEFCCPKCNYRWSGKTS